MTTVIRSTKNPIKAFIDLELPSGDTMTGFSFYIDGDIIRSLNGGHVAFIDCMMSVSQLEDVEGFTIHRTSSWGEKGNGDDWDSTLFYAVHEFDVVFGSSKKAIKKWLQKYAYCCNNNKGKK